MSIRDLPLKYKCTAMTDVDIRILIKYNYNN